MLKKIACLASILAALVAIPSGPGAARGQSVDGGGRAGDLSNRHNLNTSTPEKKP